MTEWNATAYNQHSSLQQAMAADQLARLTLNGDERVLDVGCGSGKVTASIADRVPRGSVVGVDPSRNMIAFATENYATALPNLRFEFGDARRLPYRAEFDLVVSFNALHWVHEQDAALASIRAALKPGGRAMLRFVGEGPRPSFEDVLEEVRQSLKWAAHFEGLQRPHAHFTADEYREIAEGNGLRVDGLRVIDGSWDFGSREGFTHFARATFVAWMRWLTEDDQLAFLADVLDRYRQVDCEKPGEEYTFKFLQMEVMLTAV